MSLPAAYRRPSTPLHGIQRRIEEIEYLLQGLKAEVAILGCQPVPIHKPHPTAHQVVGCVSRQFSVSPETIYAKCNSKRNIGPRRAAQYLLRKHTLMSLAEIGRPFQQHHTTVLYGLERFSDDLKLDHELTAKIALIEQSLGVQEMSHQ